MKQQEYQEELARHSLAHVLAAAIWQLWPETQFGVGPTVDDGFYYDILIPEYSLSEKDFPKIEQQMRKLIGQNLPFEKQELDIEEAKNWAKEQGQTFKQELLKDLAEHGSANLKEFDLNKSSEQSITLYQLGDFVDLCRGPHVATSSEVGEFKLTKLAGAYWRGDETRPQMQRVYGIGFATKEEVDQYIEQLEQAKLRDHRRLGKELDLFTFSPLVGAGLPMFTPRGTVMRDVLAAFSNQLREEVGFTKVWTPHITKKDLYEKSGHWAKFGQELFLVKSQETSDQFCLKPMNCPHHTQIYASRPRSYRDLPIRYLETTTPYRDEKTGELGGLSRVRSLTQDDSHVFCRPDQIEAEIDNLLRIADRMYSVFDMKLRVRLSYRDDSDAYLGDAKLWEMSQRQLKAMVEKNQLDYFEQIGEAAFYGPKIDFMASDAIGREHQVATVQLDFVQPDRFGLVYIDQDGKEQTPVMIHCAVLGTIERFMSVFIEHTAGWFPFWSAPEQVRILTVNDTPEVVDYANQLKQTLDQIVLDQPIRFNPVRASIDDSKESLGKKIKQASEFKIPAMIIVGERDVKSSKVSIRLRDEEKTIDLDELVDFVKQL